jgi:hypothetical protein
VTFVSAVSDAGTSAEPRRAISDALRASPDPSASAMPQPARPMAALPISRAEKKAMRGMAFAIEEFEPFPKFIFAWPILQSLIDKGLVERGPSFRPAVDATGFRLTEMGCRILRQVW